MVGEDDRSRRHLAIVPIISDLDVFRGSYSSFHSPGPINRDAHWRVDQIANELLHAAARKSLMVGTIGIEPINLWFAVPILNWQRCSESNRGRKVLETRMFPVNTTPIHYLSGAFFFKATRSPKRNFRIGLFGSACSARIRASIFLSISVMTLS